MSDRSLAASTPTTEQRDRTTAELCEHFAAGHIELDVLESRLAAVDDAKSVRERYPPRRLNAVAVMGGVALDFRDARLAAGETHVTAVALMGGIEIIVPPGLPVTVRGLGILGGVDQVEHAPVEQSPSAPRLKVTALACMGGVEIKTRASKRAELIAIKRSEMRR
jgi:predicted membrane protein